MVLAWVVSLSTIEHVMTCTGVVNSPCIDYVCSMPRPTTDGTVYKERRLLLLDEELATAVADYRFANRIKSEAEAIRELLRLGLKHAPKRRAA